MALVQSSSPKYRRCEDANPLPTPWFDSLQNAALPIFYEPSAQCLCPSPTVPDTLQASLNTSRWPWAHYDALPSGNSASLAEAQMPPPSFPVEAANFFTTTVSQPQAWRTDAITFPDLSIPATWSDPWETAASQPLALTNWNTDGHDDSRRKVGSQAQTEASSKRRVIQRRHPFFTCRQCGKTFTRKKNLTDHELRHRNRKDFACNISDCLSRFNTSNDLERHVRVVHKMNLRRSNPAHVRRQLQGPKTWPS